MENSYRLLSTYAACVTCPGTCSSLVLRMVCIKNLAAQSFAHSLEGCVESRAQTASYAAMVRKSASSLLVLNLCKGITCSTQGTAAPHMHVTRTSKK